MKQIENLMSESMQKLTDLIDKKHKMDCNNCGEEFDMRDLTQVMEHENCTVNYKNP